MAETRKHQPVVCDELDRAIKAALGEDVRPFSPGSDPFAPASGADDEQVLRPGQLPSAQALGVLGTFGVAIPVSPDRVDGA